MPYYLGKKTRTYNVTISVAVDNPDKPEHEKSLDEICDWLFGSMKSFVNRIDGGTGRLTVDVQRK